MSDTSKIYVYTGNESGYTNGDWYYHDGSAWADGGIYNSVAVVVDDTLTVNGMPADAKVVGDEIGSIKENLNVFRPTATAEDVGKALIVKTVADGVPTEFEYGEAGGSGGDFWTVETSNLLDVEAWTTSTSPVIPVEYGKQYTANFSILAYRIYALDANQNSLGALNSYAGVTFEEPFSVYATKRVYSIVNEDVAYIQFRQQNKPSGTPFIVEGDIDLPLTFVNQTIVPIQPDINDLREAMISASAVQFAELSGGLQSKIKELGWDNLPITIDDVYEYDESTCHYDIDNGIIYVKDGSAFVSANQSFLFKPNVYRIKFKFQYQIITNANYKYRPYIVLQSNNSRNGVLLSFNTTGGSINGIGYIYKWTTSNELQAGSNAYSFTHEYNFVSVDITKNADSFDIVMLDTQGTEVTRHYTFAELGIVDADYLGIVHGSNNKAIDKQLIAYDFMTWGKPPVSNISASPLNGVIYDAWGDSYTAPSGSYASIIGTNTNCTVHNYGVSGDKVSSVYSRMQSASDLTGEYVSVLCGVNDFLFNTSIADLKTAVQNVCTFIVTNYTTAKSCWILPPQIGAQTTNTLNLTLGDYVDAIKEVCEANSIPVLDLYHSGNWYGTISAFQSIYMSTDLLHPNAVGQNFLADKIQKFLESL